MTKRSLLYILIMLLLIWALNTACTSNDKEFIDYFGENQIKDIQAWIDDFQVKPILILGEHHGVADNYDLYLEILRMLPEEHIQLLLEMPPSFAYLCREYMKTGDEALLQKAIMHMEGTFGFVQENYQFWNSVKELSDNGKHIDVIGVDQEFQLKNAALALLTIDEERFTPVLQRIEKAGKKGTEELLQELENIVNEYEPLPVETDSDQVVKDIMTSLRQLLDNPMGDKSRDEAIYQTFVRKVDPNIRSIGIFGGDHITKSGESGSAVSKLFNEELFSDKVVVAEFFYVNSTYMEPKTGQASSMQGLSKNSIIVQHALREQPSVVVYRLPPDPLFETPNLKGLSLPDMYDYAVVIKNAKASEYFELSTEEN